MKKLSSEQRKQLEQCITKLEKLDPSNKSKYNEVLDDLYSVTNEFADISSKMNENAKVISNEDMPANNKIKNDKDKKVKDATIDNIKDTLNLISSKSDINEIEAKRIERQKAIEKDVNDLMLIDNDMAFDVIKTVIELNQKCVDISLVVLENSSDKFSKQIKKCIDHNIENKRMLKNVYKSMIEDIL